MRGTWAIATRPVNTWVADGTIYRPNANLQLAKQGTLMKTQLADGSYGYIFPETKYNDDSLKLTWFYLEKTYVDKIAGYVESGIDVRITDHNNSIYYGRFVAIDSTWLAGEVDKYDIVTTFELIPSLVA